MIVQISKRFKYGITYTRQKERRDVKNVAILVESNVKRRTETASFVLQNSRLVFKKK